jgi:general secretion pathway protein D
VIDKLDMERRQLYLEIYMLEVSIKHTTDTGAGAHFGYGFTSNGQPGVALIGSAPTPALNSLLLSPEALKGLAGGVVGPLVSGTGTLLGTGRDVPAFGAVIQALQSNSDVNVISEPHMYAADNQEATIEVGRNVPTPGRPVVRRPAAAAAWSRCSRSSARTSPCASRSSRTSTTSAT